MRMGADADEPRTDDPLLSGLVLPLLLIPCLWPMVSIAQQHAAPERPPTPLNAESRADDILMLDRITVLGRQDDLLGRATTASEGSVSREELQRRPRLRPGDLAEYVPGVAATQHSGSGKANQYFLRGFNLDHGTDFAQFVEDMPINLRTHGHGQGYSDLNFLIPELVDSLVYRKGPYHAYVGDFSSAGSAHFSLVKAMDTGLLQLEAGENGHARVVAADTFTLGNARLTAGGEFHAYDGPWKDIAEDVAKTNLMLGAAFPLGSGSMRLLAMVYDNSWKSPDQIPERAVRAGLIDELGSIDRSLGGKSSRWSLSGGWGGDLLGGRFEAGAYLVDYNLSLWSNFTYFLDDPENGDQFRQFDERRMTGFRASQLWDRPGWSVELGVEGRRDDIARVGLSKTRERVFIAPIRDDRVDERSLGAFVAGEYELVESLRLNGGLRHDAYAFRVSALQPENSGKTDDGITSLKAGLAWRLAESLELYASWGEGFHSNDARGTTIRIDPVSGDPVEAVDPLVRSEGNELGLRWFQKDRLQATLALWQLDLDSELLFVGDAGNTEATRPSERNGVELGFYWLAEPRAQLELEASYTDARFADVDSVGRQIPGAVPWVLSLGWAADWGRGWHSSLRARHLGDYPLTEDGSVESSGSTLLNLAVGKRWNRWSLELDVLNLLDSDDHDIDYAYASRLDGEPAEGIEDIHYHAFEPRTVRLRASAVF